MIGHKGEVWYVSKLENGHLISASDDGTIKMWNVNTRRCIHTLIGYYGGVLCVIQNFHFEFEFQIKNGNLVSSDSKWIIKLWNMRTNRCICIGTLEGHDWHLFV